MKKDKVVYLVPDNTILNTPRRDLVFSIPNPHLPLLSVRLLLEEWRAAITVETNDSLLTRLSNRY